MEALKMARTMTAEEVRDDHVSRMGESLGKYYHALWQEVAGLHAEWSEYVELYGTKESRIDLLNKSAPLFFRLAQDAMWEAVLLNICRLTDHPGNEAKERLTIQRLPSLVDVRLKDQIGNLVTVARQKAAFCRDWRNRHIAHTDLALTLKEGVRPLEPASRHGVRQAMVAIADVLKALSQHYLDSDIIFECRGSPGGALELLYVIHDGLAAAEDREERIRGGHFKGADLRPLDL
jgi:hypothetical protein